jgi:hypothetical protein
METTKTIKEGIIYPDTPDGLLAKELNAWYEEQGRIIKEQMEKQDEL